MATPEMAAAKKRAAADDQATQDAIQGMSSEEQAKYTAMTPDEQKKYLAELKSGGPLLEKVYGKPKVAVKPEPLPKTEAPK